MSDAIGNNRPTIRLLNKFVKRSVSTKWYDLGIELLDDGSLQDLDQIQNNYPRDASTCCTKMFQLWLERQSDASWRQLIQALREPHIEMNELANAIEQKLISINEGDVKDEKKTFKLQPAINDMVNMKIARGACIIGAILLCCLFLFIALLIIISIILALMYISGCVDVQIMINIQLSEVQIEAFKTILQNVNVVTTKFKVNQPIAQDKTSVKTALIDFSKHQPNETMAPLILMVSNFTKKLKKNHQWYSDPFIAYEGGHKMSLRMDTSSKGTHVSVYLQGPNHRGVNQSDYLPVNGYLVIELISRVTMISNNLRILTLSNHSCRTCIDMIDKKFRAKWLGFTDFASVKSVLAYYLRNDELHFKVTYSKHFWYINAVSLYMPKIPAILLSAVVSSVLIYLMLISVEIVVFCTEKSNAVLPSHSDFSIRQVKKFLFTRQSVLRSTWHITVYSTVWETIMYVLTIVMELVITAVGELVFWDESTASDNVLTTIMVAKRISVVLMFSMIVNQYMMSWGGRIIMVHPLWLVRACLFSVSTMYYVTIKDLARHVVVFEVFL